ncbi:MAG: hypothetical protein BMS9Abin33_1245 [Gammaproteobacteria bacterium]|nr:MAG: hypothetical protein BMS9Abin33_1245 [Gammaproteobacteria bacterium]
MTNTDNLKHYRVTIHADVYARGLNACFANILEEVKQEAELSGEPEIDMDIAEHFGGELLYNARVRVDILPPAQAPTWCQ